MSYSQVCRGLATVRFAGVPEHFNAPFHLAKARGLYAEQGLDFQWKMVPQGTGAMAEAVEKDEVDVAVMLSEGAVAAAAAARLKLIGTYVSSPLRWGVHVRAGGGPDGSLTSADRLKGKIFGVSRMLSGSHLMAHVMAHQLGWKLKHAPLRVVGTLEVARKAMARDEIHAWLWEKFTTKPLVDAGEWDIVGEVPTPWPCFVFAASERALEERGDEIRAAVAATRGVCREFKANEAGATLQYVAKHHDLSVEDAAEWLAGTEWACALEVEERTLRATQEALVTIGQLSEPVPFEQLYHPMCQLLRD